MSEANWYVVHTYSGYENKVKANIEKTIENRHLEDQILEVRVPMQDVVEMKNGVVTGGAWKDTTGMIQSINPQKQVVTINVELFGRETPVEISFAEIKKL